MVHRIISDEIHRLNEEISVSKDVEDAVDAVCSKLDSYFKEAFNHNYNVRVIDVGDGISIPMKYATSPENCEWLVSGQKGCNGKLIKIEYNG